LTAGALSVQSHVRMRTVLRRTVKGDIPAEKEIDVSSADRPRPRSAIARDFASPGAAWRGKSFWSWNGELDPEELRRQIRVMRRMGFGGFFIYPGSGLATPYLSKRWFECVNACIDEASKLKMETWLYDEDRWPSGTAGGLATKNPSWRSRILRFVETEDPAAFRWTPATLGAFTAVVKGHAASSVRPIPKGRRPRLAKGEKILSFELRLAEPSSWYNGQTYLDTLNPKAVREFIRVTYEACRRECGRAFGRLVPGIFTDEPNVGLMMRHGGGMFDTNALPWTDALPKLFRERYGYDLLPHLPELCYDVESRGARPGQRQGSRVHRLGTERGGRHGLHRGRRLRAGHRGLRPSAQQPWSASPRRKVAGLDRAGGVHQPGRTVVRRLEPRPLRTHEKPLARDPAALRLSLRSEMPSALRITAQQALASSLIASQLQKRGAPNG